jgi:SAM-dependent methyltransferase
MLTKLSKNDFALPPDHDFLWNQLTELPYFRALLRAVESRFYQDLPVVEPVLDLGSGDGSFAAQTFSRKLDVGLDPWQGPLWESRARHAHKLLTLAAGANMPFADRSFQTIVSNSVLEHIPCLDPVMVESYRVLKPGGYFLFCSPSEHFTDWLVGAKVFGDTYRRFFNRIARHAHCDSPITWRARLEKVGFIVERIWYYLSPRATQTLEIGHYLGLPNLISKKLFDKWVLLPSRSNPYLRFLDTTLRPLYDEPLGAVGSCLFCVARKP